ncbi:MAG TPA: uracil-DNA glycosylase family protein [Candidatus Limnocylindria bacterium]|nr:uracil-DNA glycosylase family protein [Candidatus Limnocylindria bacterium]
MERAQPSFDRGYVDEPWATLVAECPGADVYPPADFRTEWGPIFHRGRLDGTARVLVIGQDPGTHEAIVRRILVGEAGQRLQGFLARLGITRSYVLINAFVYSVYGQHGGNRHRDDPVIAAYRNRWLDALAAGGRLEAVVALGTLAEEAFATWAATPAGAVSALACRRIRHPTYPEAASRGGAITKAEAMREMLADWNAALDQLRPAVANPDVTQPADRYGATLTAEDLRAIPDADLPPGLPGWMRSLDAWATRRGETADEKRATIVVRVPRAHRSW